jgi:hypothetical protein
MVEASAEYQITLRNAHSFARAFAGEEKGNALEVRGLPGMIVAHGTVVTSFALEGNRS